SSSLLVNGFDHVAWVTQYGRSMYAVLASGDCVFDPSPIQSEARWRQPLDEPVVSVEPSQRYCCSWENVTRFFEVTCAVPRAAQILRPMMLRGSTAPLLSGR